MSDKIVPKNVALAAKRGFVRTTLQSYAATIPAGGVSAAAIIALAQDPQPLMIAATALAALASPPLAGLASWMSITSKGIPEEYAEAADGKRRADEVLDLEE